MRLTVPASRATQIAALAAAEQDRCPFFVFRIQLAGQRLHLEAPPAGAGDMVPDQLAAPS
jgi:MerR family copper efflux transcriptional regulator